MPASLAAEDVARYRDQRTYDEALWPTDPWYDPARDPVSHMLEIRGGQRNVTTCEQLTLEVRRDCDLEYLLGGLKRLSVVRARGRHTVLRVFQPLAASSKLSAQSPWCVLPLNGTVIPEGAGCVKRLLSSGFAGFRAPCRQHWVRAGGQDGAPAALARTNGLDAGPARCMLSAMPEDQRRDCVVVGSFSMLRWADTLGQGRIGSGCRSSLRPAGVGMERCGSNTRGQSSWRPRRVGGQTVQRPRACCVRGAHAALRGARARMCPSRSP